jgi:hypothetical protein
VADHAPLQRLRLEVAPGRRVVVQGKKIAGLVGQVPGQLVLQSQFLFLEAVEKVFVRVGSMLFFLNEGVKSGMLGFEFLGHCLVHWRRSFQSACHQHVINHESLHLSRAFSRFNGAKAPLAESAAAVPAQAQMS